MADAEADDLEHERRAIARAQAGELAALEPVLRAHAGLLFSAVLLPRVGVRAEAEDLVMDTMATALERIGEFQWQGRSLFFWLRAIALRRVVDLYRRRGRAEKMEEALAREAQAAAGTEAAQAPEAALAAEQDRRGQRERIEAALRLVPARYARAIRLRLIEDRPREECARELGVQVATFDVVLFRAVRAFRKAYGERDDR